MSGSSYFNGSDQVFLSVSSQYSDRKLASGQDDGFGQILQHETQGRGRISHGICSMKDDETIETVIIVLDDFHQFRP